MNITNEQLQCILLSSLRLSEKHNGHWDGVVKPLDHPNDAEANIKDSVLWIGKPHDIYSYCFDLNELVTAIQSGLNECGGSSQ